ELDRAGAQPREVESLDGAIVERDVRDLLGRARLDREAVVLARHEDAVGALVEHRMVRAAVPERKLVGLVTGREREQLVAKADAEHRNPAEQSPDRLDLVVEPRRVAGPRREPA